jgi:hypothetical protein
MRELWKSINVANHDMNALSQFQKGQIPPRE